MPSRIARWIISRPAALLVLGAVAGRAWVAHRARSRGGSHGGVLPSLYDVHPGASTAQRRRVGVRTIPLDRIVGTLRHPSQNTTDFLPLPRLRGRNWQGRWQRLNRAMDHLELLPPIDVVQVGDEYWVEDGHNRVAAALRADAVEIDADTTQLLVAGVQQPERGWTDTSSVVGGEELRQAAAGRHSRTVEQRTVSDAT
ncbi:MAG TPA: hypothetical protein VI277_07910, partial [Candidatus Limnocylindria bacterium]